ncbi:MAG TPA: YggS family pyridoxal phosphate-dependent enzyme [Terriglobales bacterium]|nr:YggS family pyridoxal phosphate-dependent enzyme [Terriglobales bacterium]
MSISENVAEVRACIESAARRAGRDPSAITLMAVSKTFPAEAICEAYASGVRVFGENRVQEFSAKASALRGLDGAQFHFIGHLQSNKAAPAAALFGAIDAIDSVKLAERLNAAAEKLGKVLPVLIEVNVGGEEAKSGLEMGSGELGKILIAAEDWKSLSLRGLMTIPPYTDDPEGARPYFRQLREIRDKVAARHLPGVSMDVLSMGMSHDFEVAIEEGSTRVRVGTAIFGSRSRK